MVAAIRSVTTAPYLPPLRGIRRIRDATSASTAALDRAPDPPVRTAPQLRAGAPRLADSLVGTLIAQQSAPEAAQPAPKEIAPQPPPPQDVAKAPVTTAPAQLIPTPPGLATIFSAQDAALDFVERTAVPVGSQLAAYNDLERTLAALNRLQVAPVSAITQTLTV